MTKYQSTAPEPAFSSTEECLQSMLTESTGRHMLDSGGMGGRHWELNQGRDFSAELPGRIHFYSDSDWYPILNVYHFLLEHLEYDGETDAEFHAYVDEIESRDSWGEDLSNWIWAKYGHREDTSKGVYEGEPMTKNDPTWSGYTYNYENNLSQDFVFHQWSVGSEEYVAIQIHNGADARGGFTAPRVFKPNGNTEGNTEYGWLDFRNASMHCDKEGCGCYAIYDGRDWEWYDEHGYSLDERVVAVDPEADPKPPEVEDNAPYTPGTIDHARKLIGRKCALVKRENTDEVYDEVFEIGHVKKSGASYTVELKDRIEGGPRSGEFEVDISRIRLVVEAELTLSLVWDHETKSFNCPTCREGKMQVSVY